MISYILKVGIYSFYVNIEKTRSTDYIHVGAKQKCITFIVSKSEERGRAIAPTEADLHSVLYDRKCDIKGRLEKRDGTLQMIKGAITFILSLYPTITKIVLQDESYITCNDQKKLRLIYYYLGVYGKTWYQDKLGAIPNHDYKDEYNECLQHLKTYLDTKPNFDNVMARVHKNIQKELKPIYERSSSLQEMIRTISKDYDCMMFRNWLDDIISRHIPILSNISWEIQAQPLIHITFSKIKNEEIPKGMMMMTGGTNIPNVIGDSSTLKY